MSQIQDRNTERYRDKPELHYLELLMLRVKEYNEAKSAYLRNKTHQPNMRLMKAKESQLERALHFLRKRGYQYYVEDKPVKLKLPFND